MQGAYDPAPVLARLEPAVRYLVTHMIQVGWGVQLGLLLSACVPSARVLRMLLLLLQYSRPSAPSAACLRMGR